MVEITVKHKAKAGIAISGGLDSTIVLHELTKLNSDVVAYTMRWGEDVIESEAAAKVAAAYGVPIRVIEFDGPRYFEALKACMKSFDKPRWNVWPYMILEQAMKDGCRHFYIGEGCDEIFGYQDRSYIMGWIGLLEYHWPTWKQAADILGIDIHAPFMAMEKSLKENIGLPSTLSIRNGRYKEALWEKYRDELKAPVLYPKRPAVPTYYDLLGMSKKELQILATKEWLNAR